MDVRKTKKMPKEKRLTLDEWLLSSLKFIDTILATVRETRAFQKPKAHENSVSESKSGSRPSKIAVPSPPRCDKNSLSTGVSDRMQ